MNLNLSKQQIITLFKSLITSRNILKEKIKLENNSTIKTILFCQLEEVDKALEIFQELFQEIVEKYI